MGLIQINLNNYPATQDLLPQITCEEDIDVVIISEPYQNYDGGIWVKNDMSSAALWILEDMPSRT